MEIFAKDVKFTGDVELPVVGNSVGNILTVDVNDVISYRTASELLIDLGGGDKYYIHDQGVAAAVWNVAHNLNKYPSVTVVDTANTVFVGQIVYTDLNNLVITFNSSFSGKAYTN